MAKFPMVWQFKPSEQNTAYQKVSEDIMSTLKKTVEFHNESFRQVTFSTLSDGTKAVFGFIYEMPDNDVVGYIALGYVEVVVKIDMGKELVIIWGGDYGNVSFSNMKCHDLGGE